MAKRARIPSEDYSLIELISRAAYCNPFSAERTEIDLKLSGCDPSVDVEERFQRIMAAVKTLISKLEVTNIRMYAERDYELMESLFLFYVFHLYKDEFDQLIRDQLEAGDTPCRVDFARDALAKLTQYGFNPDEAEQLFALFYQMRRAFYFIDHYLIGRGTSMTRLRRHLWNNIFTNDIQLYGRYLWNRMEDFSTLLLGETGTGKGMAAAAIGRSGYIPFDARRGCFVERFTTNFITINLSQFSETLIQSELFGHRKGAFTGAIDNHDGLFSRCSSHGAIFLDEIGDVSIPIQIMLLKVLQERVFSPVGSHEQKRFRGRVIAATNKPIHELRQKGAFRDDFFYRLCSDVIEVPPLRQRLSEEPGELEDMLRHIVRQIVGRESPQLLTLVQEVMRRDIEQNYAWPGNVREMEQAVRRILLTQAYQIEEHSRGQSRESRLQAHIQQGDVTAQELLESYSAILYDRLGTYEAVARQMNLDRRTVKKYILSQS